MTRFALLAAMTAIAVAIVAPAATSSPRDAHANVHSQVVYVGPTLVLVQLSYVCPSTFVAGFASAFVSQEETGGSGRGEVEAAPCTGEPETIEIAVVGGPFAPGQALASGGISGPNFVGDGQLRRVQIVEP